MFKLEGVNIPTGLFDSKNTIMPEHVKAYIYVLPPLKSYLNYTSKGEKSKGYHLWAPVVQKSYAT